MRAAGVGLGGRGKREPPVARATGTLSLLGLACAVWGQPALLGAESRSRTRVSALDIAGLEDAGARHLDWMERRAAAVQPAMDRQQWEVSGLALGKGQGAGQQDPGTERTANAR